jgi:hypothetical protein
MFALSFPQIDQLIVQLQLLNVNISNLVQAVTKEGALMSEATDNLTAAVQRETTVQSSAIALIQGLADQIKQASTDPAQVQALADQLNQNADALAQAVTANTPTPAGGSAQTTQPTSGA